MEEVNYMRKQKWFWLLSLSCLVALLGACGKELEFDLTTAEEIPETIYENHPMIGDPDAPIKLVEFGDYKCPHCKGWVNSVLSKTEKSYIEEGKVAFYFINLPIMGEESSLRALAVATVLQQDPKEAWKLHEAMFAYQHKTLDDASILAFVKKHTKGLDYNQFEKDMKNETYWENVQKDAELAETLGFSSTPSILINDYLAPEDHLMNYKAYEKIYETILTDLAEGTPDEEK